MGGKVGLAIALPISVLIGVCLRGIDLVGNTPAGVTVSQRQFAVNTEPGTGLVMVFVPLANDSRMKDRLVGMRSSCQCVTTADLPHEILPGESWSLPLRIDSSAYSPGDCFVFELTLFLESGSAVPVQINFMVTESQSSDAIDSEEREL